MNLYHYTNGTKLHLIEEAGFIRSSPEKTKLKEKPVAWLSSNHHFEKTATKIVMIKGQTKLCNMEETAQYCNGLYRFVFNKNDLPAIFQWPRLAVEARIPDKIKKRLVKRAKMAKVSASEWFGVLGNISIENAKVEKWDGQKWLEVNLIEEASKTAKSNSVRTKTGAKRLPISDQSWVDI